MHFQKARGVNREVDIVKYKELASQQLKWELHQRVLLKPYLGSFRTYLITEIVHVGELVEMTDHAKNNINRSLIYKFIKKIKLCAPDLTLLLNGINNEWIPIEIR